MQRKLILSLLAILALASCGTDGKRFKIEGHILNINQGEFYIYNDEDMTDGVDTIKVSGGRFAYDMACPRPTTLMLVFPNFSEQPIFAQPGKEATIKGDASHLKELKVTGTDDNELMSKFREQIANASPPEIKKYARMLVEDHPKSAVGAYIVKKYYLTTPEPDYREAATLVRTMLAEQPNNARLARLSTLIASHQHTATGSRLPAFTYYDTRGKLVSSAQLSSGLTLIFTWATWSYDSMDMLRSVKKAQKKSGGKLKVVSVLVDASAKDAQLQLERDTVTWPNICDGMMMESRPIRQLGLTAVPDNLLIKDGKVVAHGIPTDELDKTIERYL